VRGCGDTLSRSAFVSREISGHDGGSSDQIARFEGRHIASGSAREGFVHHGSSTKSEARAIHDEQHIQADSYTGQLPRLETLRLEEFLRGKNMEYERFLYVASRYSFKSNVFF